MNQLDNQPFRSKPFPIALMWLTVSFSIAIIDSAILQAPGMK